MNARSFIDRQPEDNGAITLRELNRRVALQLSVPQLQNVWVTAELSDVRESGGHCYLELIDKNEATGIIDARLRGIIWASAFYKISANFTTFTGQKLATGLKVMVRGSVN
ncbi:MAG: exodeoxyribonuclease VII large subunit [Paramuribaculum sp.]|nr:exodeoxyribonuclease VII large subunit [Paramuribaculum sp.]